MKVELIKFEARKRWPGDRLVASGTFKINGLVVAPIAELDLTQSLQDAIVKFATDAIKGSLGFAEGVFDLNKE